jgi:LytS/YehU family sensor histidine kinase
MEFDRTLVASEFHALNAQLQPHFVFNALHGISTLVDTDPGRAKAMMLKLSSFLRRTLEHNNSDLISLEEELRFVREYLDLEEMRLGDRLAVTWSIDGDAVWVLVPQLILQPLVENAVKHGVCMLREGGRIEISARRSEQKLVLRVRNPFGESRAPGTGIGLRNTVARLKYLYSDDASFSFSESGNRTATASVALPVLGSPESHLTYSQPTQAMDCFR